MLMSEADFRTRQVRHWRHVCRAVVARAATNRQRWVYSHLFALWAVARGIWASPRDC